MAELPGGRDAGAMAKTSLLAVLWFLALVTWGNIGRVLFDLPDIGAVAGFGAALILLLSRNDGAMSGWVTRRWPSIAKGSNLS